MPSKKKINLADILNGEVQADGFQVAIGVILIPNTATTLDGVGPDEVEDDEEEAPTPKPKKKAAAKVTKKQQVVEDDEEEDEEDDDIEDEEDEDVEDDEEEDEEDDEEGEDFWTEDELKTKTIGELRALARDYDIDPKGLKKPDLIAAILDDEEEF